MFKCFVVKTMTKPTGKPKGRPREYLTEPHCYSIFIDDAQKIRLNGWSPKEVMRLGILSKENDPQLQERITDQQRDHESLYRKFQYLNNERLDLLTRIKNMEEIIDRGEKK